MRHGSAADAIAHVASGHRVFVHGGVATPPGLIDALVDQADRLRDVELVHLHTSGPAAYADPRYASSFRIVNLFVGPNLRGRLDHARVDYLPVFLSEIPALFRAPPGRTSTFMVMLHVAIATTLFVGIIAFIVVLLLTK